MADPQGLIVYAGMRSLLSGSFTLSHGVSPSTCSLYIVPQTQLLPSVGPLVLSYGSGSIVFPDCRLVQQDFEVSRSGVAMQVLTIQDTRWRWKRGRISGEYNVKRHDGEPRPETIKSARALMALLFEAIGVDRPDIGQVPDNVFPERIWEYARADTELARLAEDVGCRVVLNAGNKVKVCKAGVGANLPLGNDVLDNSLGLQPADRPDVLRFVGGRSLWNVNLLLEAIGQDLDESIKPIDELSYTPAWGWGSWDPTTVNEIKDKKVRELCKKWIFKFYRVKGPIILAGGLAVAGEQIPLDRILPLTDKQVLTQKIEGVEEAKPAIVYGIYCLGEADPLNNVNVLTGLVRKFPKEVFTRGHQIERERGWVEFDEPVYKIVEPWNEGRGGPIIGEAELYLRTAISVRDAETRAWRHYEQDLAVPGPKWGGKPEIILHDDIVAKSWQSVAGGPVIDNAAEVKKAAGFYLAAAMQQWLDKTPGTITYGGFKNITLDGAVQQVSYNLTDKGVATTRASRNRDDPSVGMTFAERRYQEKVLALLGNINPGPPDPRKDPMR